MRPVLCFIGYGVTEGSDCVRGCLQFSLRKQQCV